MDNHDNVDLLLAIQLQEQFEEELRQKTSSPVSLGMHIIGENKTYDANLP